MKHSRGIFFKSILVGIGGIAPGLSGSVMMIIFGLYRDVLDALGTLFVDFRRKLAFLLPILAGMVVGVLAFSKVLNFLLNTYEVPTRFTFLGLILGTVPLFHREVKKEGFSWKYYLLIALSVAAGALLFSLDGGGRAQITDPNLPQKILLGFCVVTSAIVPGVDPAVLLSSLGLYEVYVAALAEVDLSILGPMLIGVAAGGIGVSFLMSRLFKRFYTVSFSIIFGIFLSMIPHMLTENCRLGLDGQSLLSVVLLLLGFAVSYFMGDFEKNRARLKARFGRE